LRNNFTALKIQKMMVLLANQDKCDLFLDKLRIFNEDMKSNVLDERMRSFINIAFKQIETLLIPKNKNIIFHY